MTAARLGELFGTNPLVILDSSPEDWYIILACGKLIASDRESHKTKKRTIFDEDF